MGFRVQSLWQAPEVHPITKKARSIPILNVVNIYGRVFFFGWFGFMVAFWSWYAFPPLLSLTIKADLNLSNTDIANSNIVGLMATLIVRVVAGPMCDLFGPRYTFAACLFAGALPTALAGTISNVNGLLTIRFFVGILGGSFVPCQVWSTGFFDKNVVGTSNALAGGWGNSGGGITYFLMPAIFDSLVSERGLSAHVAWRVSFVVPFIVIVCTASLMLLLCPDTPSGKWADRHIHAEQNLTAAGVNTATVEIKGAIIDKSAEPEGTVTPTSGEEKEKVPVTDVDHDAILPQQSLIDTARGEVVVKPTFKEAAKVVFTLQTAALAFSYFNSFGTELAVNSILGAYYLKNFPTLLQTGTGRWAAMFGLLNIVFRPLGGIGSDLIYRKTKSLWAKKFLMHGMGVIAGIMLIVIGVLNPHDQSTMFGLIALFGLFLEAGNGCCYALVPHVHPQANGIISGVVGAIGNLGGIVYSIIFRYELDGATTNYAKVFWIIGIMMIGMHLSVSWIPPISKNQIGGR